ncbi:nucleoside triphosphatase YtkD [Bacillus sp. B15-48]|nr:nucleoside triphosphatase YtkD [Bacillus sp. B15-48]MBM4762650.1 nucleoside triphosphatase YtkD [Bacillus sp. B15-48]
MKTFQDKNGNEVSISFEKEAFDRQPNHVLVICRFQGKWLLTDHKKRGWEFPGGKREEGETLEQAAAREVLEETGGYVKTLKYIGDYEVKEENHAFIKRIYFAEVSTLTKKENFHETNGPVFETRDILIERFKNHYSFIMKDDVLSLTIQRLHAAGI